jgi:hypothetical protein
MASKKEPFPLTKKPAQGRLLKELRFFSRLPKDRVKLTGLLLGDISSGKSEDNHFQETTGEVDGDFLAQRNFFTSLGPVTIQEDDPLLAGRLG